MTSRFHLLAIYAHPDDEAFSAAGTFGSMTDRGHQVTLICATRGEAGEISDPALATPETLGQVREEELRRAMKRVGVSDVRFLDYRDSGMKGTAENLDPRAFIQAPLPRLAIDLEGMIREIGPDAVLTFGPDGVYGHPDHIHIHHGVLAAIEAIGAADESAPALYYNAVPRERIIAMSKRANGPFANLSEEELNQLGTPEELITTVIDVESEYDRKLATIREHRTQVAPNGPWNDLEPNVVRKLMQFERFRLVEFSWNLVGSDPLAAAVSQPLPV